MTGAVAALRGLGSCAPSLPVQLALLVVQALFWRAVIPLLGRRVFRPLVDAHPRSRQWVELVQATLLKSYGIRLNFGQAYAAGVEFMGVLCQHAVGGLLCLPAVALGTGSGRAAWAALARHGALCEAGWELQDSVEKVRIALLGDEEVRARNPPLLLALAALHHLMSLSLVIPMNLYYEDNYWYFRLVGMLQGASAVASGAQLWGFFLDVRTRSGLWGMRVLTGISLAVTLHSRLVAYWFVIIQLLIEFRKTSRTFFTVGAIMSAIMGLLNILFIVEGAHKFWKFASVGVGETDTHAAKTSRRKAHLVHLPQGKRAWAKVRGAAILIAASHSSHHRCLAGGAKCVAR